MRANYTRLFFAADCVLSEFALSLEPMYIVSFRSSCRRVRDFTDTEYFRRLYRQKWAGLYKQFITKPPTVFQVGESFIPRDKADFFVRYSDLIPAGMEYSVGLIFEDNSVTISIIIFGSAPPGGTAGILVSIVSQAGNFDVTLLRDRDDPVKEQNPFLPDLMAKLGWPTLLYQPNFDHLVWCLGRHGVALKP